MKNSKMLAIVVLALALMVWPVSTALGVVSLTVNGEAVDEITLREGQTCTVEIVSDNSGTYDARIGFDYGWSRGDFSHLETTPEAGYGAYMYVYNEPTFQGYSVGIVPYFPPSPGVHFIFEYTAQEIGQATLKLYNSTFTSLLDSVDITIRGMGTAFTYQGSFSDGGSPADGLYDFQFRLYDDANTADSDQVGSTIDVNDFDVIEGYFTIELDFGPDVFTGSARWLETDIRPGDSNDVNDFVTLSPRQELTPVPYAVYAKTAGVQAPLHLTDLVSSDAVIKGTNVTDDGSGVAGVNTGEGDGVHGENVSTGHYGRLGTNLDGAFGQSSAFDGSGVAGVNIGVGNGVYGRSNNGKAVHGVSSDGYAGYFRGDVTLTKPAGQGGGELVLRTETYNEAGRYRIRFENNALGVFAGDDTQNQEFSFLSRWGGIREYDARLTIHGKADGSWGKYIDLTHDGTDGKISTDTGNILLLPDANVGIGTSSPGDKLDVAGHINSSQSYKLNGQTVLSHTGLYNIYAGEGAGASITTGARNSAVGFQALYSNSTASYNSAMGYTALRYTTASYNSAMGGRALYNDTTGYGNSAVGYSALYRNTTGYSNTAVGRQAGYNTTTGFGNVFLGYQAGYNETGSNKLYIANSSDDPPLISGQFDTGRVGINTTYPVYQLHVVGNIAYTGSLYHISDRRLKENISPLEGALEKISCINSIYFNKKEESPDKREVGVIAQDVETVLPELVSTAEDGYKWVDYAQLSAVLVEAVKELKAENQELKEENREFRQRIDALETSIRPILLSQAKEDQL